MKHETRHLAQLSRERQRNGQCAHLYIAGVCVYCAKAKRRIRLLKPSTAQLIADTMKQV